MSATAVSERARTATRRPRLGIHFGANWLLWIAVALIMLFCLFPFYWLINVSLKTGADLSSSKLVPPHPSFRNYSSVLKNHDFLKALRNSAIISLATTTIWRQLQSPTRRMAINNTRPGYPSSASSPNQTL